MNLRDSLDQCSLALLRQIAIVHGVSLPEAPARAELVRLIHDRLSAGGYLENFVTRLSDEGRRALGLVAVEGGRIRGFVLDRRVRQNAGSQLDRARPEHPLAFLQQAGLLYRVFQAAGADRGEVFVLPEELVPLVPATAPADDRGIAATTEPTETLVCSPSFNLFALASFLRRWRQRESRSTQPEGQLAALGREMAELAVELPDRSARERWTLLAHLGLQIGVFSREPGGLQPTDALEAALEPVEPLDRQLWDAYAKADHWDDLERSGSGSDRFAGRISAPTEARSQLLNVIRSLQADVWVLAKDIQAAVREQAPDFLREGFELGSASVVDLDSGEVLAGSQSWERIEGALLQYFLTGPLYWLGVVEWGKRDGTWDRVRLTSAGRIWLEDSEEALRPPPEPLELTEERVLRAPLGIDLSLLWQLEPYLSLERRGPPSEYKLSRASFGRGLEAGGSASDFERLLNRATDSPPMAFKLVLERWAARVGRFRLRPTVVLTADDETELDDVIGRAAIAELIQDRLGPRSASVAIGRAAELAQKLEQLGQLPEVDAALRLMAGRRAYPALVDQQSLEALLFCLRLLKALKPALLTEVPNSDRLTPRLEQALGPIATQRLARRAKRVARELRNEVL